jgi:outer membrane protein assembly factor BamB
MHSFARTIRVVFGAAALTAWFIAAVSAAEPSPFPQRGVDAQSTGRADVAPVTKPCVVWERQVPKLNDHERLAMVAGPGGKRLYAIAGSHLITLDAGSGEVLDLHPGKFLGGPTIAGTTLLVTGDDWIRAFDVSGEKPVEQWTYTTPGPMQSSSKYSECLGGRSAATVVDDLVLVGGPGKTGCYKWFQDTRAYAVDLATGRHRWTLDTGRMVCPAISADTGRGLCFFAVSGEPTERQAKDREGRDVIRPAEKDNGAVLAVRMADGTEQWRQPLGTYSTASGPAIADGVVYCGGDTEAMAFAADDGRELWRSPRANKPRHDASLGPVQQVVLTPELFVIAQNRVVEAHRRSNGELVWSLKRDDIGSIVAARDVLYTAAYHSALVQGIDLASGRILWEHRLPEQVKQSVGWLCPLEGRLVIGNYSAMIYCLGDSP